MNSTYKLHFVSLVVLGIFCILAAGSMDESSSTSSSTNEASSTPTVPDSPAMLKDAQALDEKYGIEASLQCASGADDYLRSIAKYDYKWDDTGFLETKFDHYSSRVITPGVLTSISSKAKLQNGFGAFQHIELLCYYDTQSKKVIRYSFQSDN